MSNLKHEETVIDGITFGTTQFGGFRALELMGKLAQTIGPALGVLSAADPSTPLEALAPHLAQALSGMKPTELSALALEVLSQTTATMDDNGTIRRIDIKDVPSFNRVFTGRLMTMFKVCLHALKVNYSDFGFGSAPVNESAPNLAMTE
jgi:hypothetical protein